MTLAIGLMSGTSGDGVSAALVDFKNRSFRLLAYQTFPYPKLVREKISRALDLKTDEISSLHVVLGRIFANAALKVTRKAGLPPRKIKVIGSHGQTIYHGPRDPTPSTFQIGEAGVIAEKTRIPVVNDFRPQDIALGGEGAPLIPFFDHHFYGKGPVRAFQNIGGIANVTIAGRLLKNPIAFDTGPGNCLIDLAIQKITKGRLSYDPSGKWAARGRINPERVRSLMSHPYFKKRPPKSTGREEFGEEFLRKYFIRSWTRHPYDVLATLTYFTALSIFESLRPFSNFRHVAEIQEILVSGGGAKNLTLMSHLGELFSPIPVRSVKEWGIPVQAKESIGFAFFALRALQRRINHLPQTTGASHATILGKITRPAGVIARQRSK